MSIYDRAKAYFSELGIDPSVKPDEAPEKFELPEPSHLKAGITTMPCTIHLVGVLFYAYCEVTVPGLGKFEGHSGGVGIGGLTSAGVIYFADKKTLLDTETFGVGFLAEDGGIVQVTWGSHGNATAAGVGDGMGAFGGKGSWK